jgi:hypothetical protein
MTTVGRERWILGADYLDLLRRLRDRAERRTDSQTDYSMPTPATNPEKTESAGRAVVTTVAEATNATHKKEKTNG